MDSEGGGFGSGVGNIHAIDVFNVPQLYQLPTTSINRSFNFSWETAEGLHYQLQYKNTLNDTNWVNLGTAMAATNGVLSTADLISTNQQRFYRIMQLP